MKKTKLPRISHIIPTVTEHTVQKCNRQEPFLIFNYNAIKVKHRHFYKGVSTYKVPLSQQHIVSTPQSVTCLRGEGDLRGSSEGECSIPALMGEAERGLATLEGGAGSVGDSDDIHWY